MKRPRKIIAYLAMSTDGFIARRDGNVDWLDRPRPPGNYDMGVFLRSIDTILWGRKTYELALRLGGHFWPKIKNYVFSRRPRRSIKPSWEFVREPIGAFAKRLRAAPGKDIWIMGGAGLFASFLDAGEMDELIIHVVPTLIGEGIPLLQPRRRQVKLALRSSRRFSDAIRARSLSARSVCVPPGPRAARRCARSGRRARPAAPPSAAAPVATLCKTTSAGQASKSTSKRRSTSSPRCSTMLQRTC